MIGTTDIAARVGTADTRLWTAWFEAVAAHDGNRHEIELRHLDDIALLGCSTVRDSYYNRIMGVSRSNTASLPEALAAFSERRVPFRVDMNPFDSDESVSQPLIGAGLYPGGFQTSLYGEAAILARESQLAPGLVVREVRRDEIAFFARLYNRSYHHGTIATPALTRLREASVVARYGRAGWRHYLALADGMPAGGALLHVDGDVATLAGAATVFTMRRRGVQGALLARRLSVAAELGCTLVLSRCAVGSVSQRNMERVGLRTAYTKVVWVNRERPR